MRLHLASEDVEASLEAEGTRATRRMPLAVTEISHIQVVSYEARQKRPRICWPRGLCLQSDVGVLSREVAKALQQLSLSASKAGQAVLVIRETELARSRMQAASDSLKARTLPLKVLLHDRGAAHQQKLAAGRHRAQ